jgi:hypothetical protein
MATYDLTGVPNRLYQIYEGAEGSRSYRHALNVATDMATQTAGDVAHMLPLSGAETVSGGVTYGYASYVYGAWLEIITPSTTSGSTVNVGDNESATQYLSGTSATATAGTVTMSPMSTAKVYYAADDINMVLGTTAPANGVFGVGAIIINIPVTGQY